MMNYEQQKPKHTHTIKYITILVIITIHTTNNNEARRQPRSRTSPVGPSSRCRTGWAPSSRSRRHDAMRGIAAMSCNAAARDNGDGNDDDDDDDDDDDCACIG